MHFLLTSYLSPQASLHTSCSCTFFRSTTASLKFIITGWLRWRSRRVLFFISAVIISIITWFIQHWRRCWRATVWTSLQSLRWMNCFFNGLGSSSISNFATGRKLTVVELFIFTTQPNPVDVGYVKQSWKTNVCISFGFLMIIISLYKFFNFSRKRLCANHWKVKLSQRACNSEATILHLSALDFNSLPRNKHRPTISYS